MDRRRRRRDKGERSRPSNKQAAKDRSEQGRGSQHPASLFANSISFFAKRADYLLIINMAGQRRSTTPSAAPAAAAAASNNGAQAAASAATTAAAAAAAVDTTAVPVAGAAVPAAAPDRPKRLERTTACVPIVYGSVAFYLGKKADEYQTHQWTLHVRGPDGSEDLSQVVSKVVFQLHASFAQPTRELTDPPYEVTERGWGEFEAQIRIVWKDPTEKSTVVRAELLVRASEFPSPFTSWRFTFHRNSRVFASHALASFAFRSSFPPSLFFLSFAATRRCRT